MKLCYYHDNEGNFGDDLNAWLWSKLLPGVAAQVCFQPRHQDLPEVQRRC